MHERLSGGSGENVASDHIGNLVSDLRENQPKWWSDKRNETLTDISGGYLRYMQVSAFDGGEDWSNYSREILTTSKEVVGSAVGSSLSFLFSINISFSDSEWAWDTHDSLMMFQGCYTRCLDLPKQRDSKAWKTITSDDKSKNSSCEN
ncbi:unnamed protein product [Brassica rapa subsp. narinosa]